MVRNLYLALDSGVSLLCYFLGQLALDGLTPNHYLWFLNILEQNVKKVLVRFLRHKNMERTIESHNFYLSEATVWKPSFAHCLSCSASLSLSLSTSISFLCSFPLKAFSFPYSLSLSTGFLSSFCHDPSLRALTSLLAILSSYLNP